MVDTDVRPWHLPPSCRNEFCPFCHATLLSEHQPNAVCSLRGDNLATSLTSTSGPLKRSVEMAKHRRHSVATVNMSTWTVPCDSKSR
jgi:hypothetical protein